MHSEYVVNAMFMYYINAQRRRQWSVYASRCRDVNGEWEYGKRAVFTNCSNEYCAIL